MNKTTKSAEINEYDARYASGGYGGGRAGYKNNFVRFMRESLQRLPGGRPAILDVGCGDGYFTAELAKHGDVTATDFSEDEGLVRAHQHSLCCAQVEGGEVEGAHGAHFERGNFEILKKRTRGARREAKGERGRPRRGSW
jgi:SAM-dependent methyltransferase